MQKIYQGTRKLEKLASRKGFCWMFNIYSRKVHSALKCTEFIKWETSFFLFEILLSVCGYLLLYIAGRFTMQFRSKCCILSNQGKMESHASPQWLRQCTWPWPVLGSQVAWFYCVYVLFCPDLFPSSFKSNGAILQQIGRSYSFTRSLPPSF